MNFSQFHMVFFMELEEMQVEKAVPISSFLNKYICRTPSDVFV